MLSKLLPIFCAALITISISISSWTMKEVVDLKTRIASLEADRLTPSDRLEIWDKIHEVKEEVTKLNTALPNQGPPAWFIDQVKKMETNSNARIDKIEDTMAARHEERMNSMFQIEKKLDEHAIIIGQMQNSMNSQQQEKMQKLNKIESEVLHKK